MSFAHTWRTIVRRVENMDFETKLRNIRRYPKRRLAIIGLIAIILIFVFTRSSKSSSSLTREQHCINEKFKFWEKSIQEFDVGVNENSVEFVGNGFMGVDSLGQLRLQEKNRALDVETNFYPSLNVEIEGSPIEVNKMTDFRNGIFKVLRCFTMDGECACVTSSIYAHRTRPNVFVQTVQVSNPSKSTVRLSLNRLSTNWWAKSKRNEVTIHTRQIGNNSYAIICTDAPEKIAVSQKREETFQFICTVVARSNSEEASAESLKQFTAIPPVIKLDSEHTDAWRKMGSTYFSVSTSKAPSTLNGDRINATKYIILSNLRAPTIEVDASVQQVKTLESESRKNELCYTGHSNMLFPSRLWRDWDTPSKLIELVRAWMLTFEKRGCSNVLKTGAIGASQAFVQSLTAASYHDSHLEIALDAHDLHREMSFGGLAVHSSLGTIGTINVEIKLNEENRPYFLVSSSNQLFACDGGCLDKPVSLGKTATEIRVKVTKPVTSLLYVATNRRHLEQLKSAIHVSEVGSAPAHEEEVLELHRSGESSGGLPTSVWVLLGILLIAFHVFLGKLFWNEWRKGDMTPYNPYLRNRYSSMKPH